MSRYFELSTYTPTPGTLPALVARFRDHTLRLFERHGMTNVGYWLTTEDEPRLVYLLAHDSPEAAEAAWKAFGDDPEWQQVYRDSMRNGPLTVHREKLGLTATDFSPIT